MVNKAGYDATLEALKALDGVGDESLGEWFEVHEALHVRRRLSISEQLMRAIDAVDLRCTDEGYQKIQRLLRAVPMMKQFALEEFER